MRKTISYKIRRSKRAKRIRITVYCDGSVIVTSPFGVQSSIAKNFLSDKKEWVWDKIQSFKDVKINAIGTFSYKDYLENKERARILVHERIRFYNQIYNFSFNNISIKNQKTCWGSCSSKKNINLNYRIIFLPQKYQDYIIVHEICHLKEFNHSKKFWALVEKTIPDYLSIKKGLRSYGLFYK